MHDAHGQLLASTADLEPQISNSVPQVVRVLAQGRPAASFLHAAKRSINLYTSPLLVEEKPIGVLTLFHDASYIDLRLEEIWKHNIIRFLVQWENRIPNPSFPRLLTLKKAADYLGMTVWALRERVWAGLIPVVQFPGGRKMWIDGRDLDSLIERNKRVYD